MSEWWKERAIYQIYPRSFQDTTGDGVGDLAGIRRRLDHVKELGAGAIWLSPIFRSPMADFGYDVSDYTDIDPLFGSMADFEALLAEAHERDLKLLLDFVPNHSSAEHPWFQESRSSRDNPKRDWYIWKDAAPGGGPPNNWMSNFGGSAWEWDEATGQYYYHAFLKEQPDLNWRNPEVRRAMHDVLRFWFDKGVDGFRIDVIWHLAKDAQFRDNPPNPNWKPGQPDIQRHRQKYSADQPFVHQIVAELRDLAESYRDRLLIGEIYLPVERLVAYYGRDGEGLHLPFNFQLLQARWDADTIRVLIEEYEAALPQDGWPNWVLSNHDKPRIAARVGEAQARIAAALLLTLRGTPTIYYGDELGIADVHIPDDRIQDPWAKLEPDASFNRDEARTPMQWTSEKRAGFSEVEPWLPLTDDHHVRNVSARFDDEGSMLALYCALLSLRGRFAELREGAYEAVECGKGILGYARGGSILVALNLSADDRGLNLPEKYRDAEILLRVSSGEDGGDLPDRLAGNEGLILLRKEPAA